MYTTNTTSPRKTEYNTQMPSVEDSTGATYQQSSSAAPIILGGSSQNDMMRAIDIIPNHTLAPEIRSVSREGKQAVDNSIYEPTQNYNNVRHLYYLLNNPNKLLEALQNNTDPSATLKDLVHTDILDIDPHISQIVDTKPLFTLAIKYGMKHIGEGRKDDSKTYDMMLALLLMISDAKYSVHKNKQELSSLEKSLLLDEANTFSGPLKPSRHPDFWKAVIASPTKYKISSPKNNQIPAELKEDKTTALALIARNQHFLKHLSSDLKGDKNFVTAAIRQNTYCFMYASNELRNNKAFVLEQIHYGGMLYASIPNQLKQDREIIIAAITEDPKVLIYTTLPEGVCADKEIMMIALKKDPSFFNMIKSGALKTDPDIRAIMDAHRDQGSIY